MLVAKGMGKRIRGIQHFISKYHGNYLKSDDVGYMKGNNSEIPL
jgi:hypothetical protein